MRINDLGRHHKPPSGRSNLAMHDADISRHSDRVLGLVLPSDQGVYGGGQPSVKLSRRSTIQACCELGV